ncbi:MAG: hypothetical protein R3F20_03815 [Planctomycetota bacterium]
MTGMKKIASPEPDRLAPALGRPFLLSVAGDGSNCGKTRLVTLLLAAAARRGRVGALKVSTSTPDHRCARTGLACGCLRFEGQMRFLEGEEYTRRRGKDTFAYHEAGAHRVAWLQTTSDFAAEAGAEAARELASFDVDLVVVEGAALARAGRTDALVLVRREDRPEKAGFSELLPRADLVLASRRGGGEGTFDPDGAELPSGLESLLDRIFA